MAVFLFPKLFLKLPILNYHGTLPFNFTFRLMEFSNNYSEFSRRILEKFFPELPPPLLLQMCQKAYTFAAPVTDYNSSTSFFEQFHGPTSSFKDFALSLFPQIFEHCAKVNGDKEKHVILVSTSGDTGSSAMNGFLNTKDVSTITMFPAHGVSTIQKLQMLSLSQQFPTRCKTLALNSDFDFW